MKIWLWIAIVVAGLLPQPSGAEGLLQGPIGLGVMLGDPIGLNLKYMSNGVQALNLGAAINMEDSGDLHLHADYQHHFYPLDEDDWNEGSLAVYVGVGVRLRRLEEDDDDAGLRLPLGASVQLEGIPIDLFAEVAPVLVFLPERDVDADWGVGVRFWF